MTKTDPAGADMPRVADVIRRYLAAHPQAADTAAGIQRWWVLPECGEVSLSVVEAALAQLEAAGEVCRDEQAWSLAAVHRAARRPPPEAH